MNNICKLSPIDCDVHPTIPDTRVLTGYLDDYWREHVLRRGIEREDLQLSSFPLRSPLFARPDWIGENGVAGADLKQLQSDIFGGLGAASAICNVFHGGQIMFSEDLSGALCAAINNWIAAELLDRDPRLRASIVVPLHSPALAAKEIELRSADKRFVQVLLLAMAELPLGRRYHWPVYEAAERHGLPVGIHAGSSFRHPPTALGWPSYQLEDYVVQSSGIAGALTSLITEGVFVKFPKLKVVLIESGVTWLPPYLWRMDKSWRAMRSETPWLDRLPSETVRSNVRLTIQPFDNPRDSKKVEIVLDQIDCEAMLLFSSDYPHWQFDGDNVLPDGIPGSLLQRIMIENPIETYGAGLVAGQDLRSE
jgi:uncharacterized protein